MQDVTITTNDEKTTWVCHIEDFSNDLKSEIRKNLVSICYGQNAAQSQSNLYSYKSTLREFIARYDSKTDKIKKGLIGELLAHVIILKEMPHMVPASPYFNMEERSMKKGFDLILLEPESDTLWITEFKSGSTNATQLADQKNSSLIESAKADLKERLNENKASLWLNAIASARNAIQMADAKQAVVTILENIGSEVVTTGALSTERDVILSTITYADLGDKISLNTTDNKRQIIDDQDIFKNVVVFSIQKATFTRVAQFLVQEAA